MSELWIPEARRLTPSAPGGTITSTAPPRVVWHTTEAPSGKPVMFGRMHDVLTDKSAEPHILIDPITDELGQYFPLNTSGRALRNDTDGTRNNRVGRVCIQIEVIGYAANPFTNTWKPGPNWHALMRAVRSWGIPDALPAGPPPKYPGPSNRPRDTWRTRGGHYSHANIPGNDHGDPGAISMSKIFALGKGKTDDQPEELFTVGQFEDLMQQVKNEGAATRQEVRRQAIWSLRYGVQTEDERARADAAFDAAIAEGKTLAEAIAAVSAVMRPIDDDLERRAAENG